MKRIILILLMCSCFILQGQPPSKWFKKFGGSGIEIGYGVKETYDRQYVIVGSTTGAGAGSTDAYLILLDSMGNMTWQKTFGGVLSDVAKSVVVNPVDSGFIFTGFTNSFGNGGYDVYVVRTNKNGDMIWQRSFGGVDWDLGNDMALTPDGHVIICGYTFSKGYGKKDGYLLKINSVDGSLIWEKFYGGAEDDDFRGIELASNNNFYLLTGRTNSYNDLSGDIYLLKTGLNGDSLFYKSYGLAGKLDYGNDIIERSTTEYVIGGGSESYSSGKMDAFIFNLTNLGDSVWLRNYGNSSNDQETKKLVYSKNYQGKYVITFGEIEVPFFKRDPKTLMLEGSGGYYVHGGTIGSFEDEEFLGLTNTRDKGFIGVGYTKSYGSINEDIFIIKYDSIIGINSGDNLIGLTEKKFENDQIKIYPTVVSHQMPYVTFITDKEFYYRIYDLYSHKVQSKGEVRSLQIEERISLESIPPGIYLLEIEMNGKKVVSKIIKQ